jgi:hypothetical protein
MGCEGFLKGDAEMEERRILNVECRILKGGSVLDLPQRREGRRGARRFFEGKRGGAEGAEGDAEQTKGIGVEWSAGSWWWGLLDLPQRREGRGGARRFF